MDFYRFILIPNTICETIIFYQSIRIRAQGSKENNERRKKSAEAGLHPNRDKAVKQVAAFYQEIEEAYMAISKKIDPDYQEEKNWLENFFSKNRRSNWSQDEGYVPYTKRERQDSDPISQEKLERYPYLEE